MGLLLFFNARTRAFTQPCDYKSPAKLSFLVFFYEPWSIDHHRPLHLGFIDFSEAIITS